MKLLFLLLLVLLSSVSSWAKETVSLLVDKAALQIGDTLHFDVLLSSDEALKSKVLYVELLAPEGYVAERQTLKLQDDRAGGSMVMREPNASGLFELRAFTRYGLSQDEGNYASRVLPVYEMVDGRKALRDRKRTYNKPEKKRITHFSVAPEQGITLRGKVIDYLDRPYTKVSLPVIFSAGKTSFRTMTDGDGQFAFELGDVYGHGEVSVVYDYRQVKGKKKPRIVLDRRFSPDPRAYTPHEDSLAIAYRLITTKHSRDALHPSMWFMVEDVINDYLDSEWYAEYYEGKEIKPYILEPMLFILFDEGMFEGDGGIRFVDFHHPWSHADSLYEHHFNVHEGFQLNEQLEDYERVFVSTDTNFCNKVSYDKFNPIALKGNQFEVEGVSSTGMTDIDQGVYLGFNHSPGSGGAPSVVECLVPYPEDKPLQERASYSSPYIRRFTLRGFSRR